MGICPTEIWQHESVTKRVVSRANGCMTISAVGKTRKTTPTHRLFTKTLRVYVTNKPPTITTRGGFLVVEKIVKKIKKRP